MVDCKSLLSTSNVDRGFRNLILFCLGGGDGSLDGYRMNHDIHCHSHYYIVHGQLDIILFPPVGFMYIIWLTGLSIWMMMDWTDLTKTHQNHRIIIVSFMTRCFVGYVKEKR